METLSVNGNNIQVDSVPDECPLCHHKIVPEGVSTHMFQTANGLSQEVIFSCPQKQCGRAFIARYFRSMDAQRRLLPVAKLQGIGPKNPKQPEIPQEVKTVSPLYVEVSGQAVAAEAYGLDQIAGVGFRKALEFLVKDFCVSKNPGKAEEIKKSLLGTCISEFVDDTNVKQCAKLATWLGNDETHYVRKWEEKDIRDLKILIRLTESWIQNSILTDKYLREMGGGA